MLKSWLTVEAILRRADRAGIMAVVVQRGDGDAGAIVIRFIDQDGSARILTPTLITLDGAKDWRAPRDGLEDAQAAEAYISRRIAQDPDCWVLDIWSTRTDDLLVPAS